MRRADLREWAAATKVSAPARLVFAMLYAHMNKTGRSWPSFKTLAAETGLARSTVQLAVDELEGAGDVVVTRRVGRPHIYLLSTGGTETVPTVGNPGVPMVGNHPTDSPRKGYRQSVPKELKEEKKERGAAAALSTRASAAAAQQPAAPSPVITDERGTFLPGTGWVR